MGDSRKTCAEFEKEVAKLLQRVKELEEAGNPLEGTAGAVSWDDPDSLGTTDPPAIGKDLGNGNESHFRDLYQGTPVLLFAADSENRIISASNHLRYTLGKEPDEILGRPIWEFFCDASQDKLASRVFPKLADNGFARNIPLQLEKADGQPLEVLFSAVVEWDGQTRPARTLACMVDVSGFGRPLPEPDGEALLLQTMLDAIPEPIGLRGLDHSIIRYNRASYLQAGLEPGACEAKMCYQLAGRQAPCPDCPGQRALETGEMARVARLVPEQEKWLDIRAYPVRDGSGNIIQLVEHIRPLSGALPSPIP